MPRRPVVAALALLLAGVVVSWLARAIGPDEGSVLLSGWWFALAGPDRLLAILGIGLVAASLSGHGAALVLGAFALGTITGAVAPQTEAWPLLTDAAIYRGLTILGPAACGLAGLALLLPDRLRAWVAPLASFSCALALGLAAGFNDPQPPLLGIGAGLSQMWLVVTLVLLAGLWRRRRFAVAEKIFGSWMLAIGLLLAGAHLIPPRDIAPVVADPLPMPPFSPGADPAPFPPRSADPFSGGRGPPQAF